MSISVAIVRGIVWELRARGVDPKPLLAHCGLAERSLQDTRLTIGVDTYHALVCQALEATRDPGLGLVIGLGAPEAVLHVVGHLMLASATLREALTTFLRFFPLLATSGHWELTEQGDRARFSYWPASQRGASTRFTNEFVMSMAFRVGRHFEPCRERPPPAVHFQHAAPSYAARYEAAFGGPVQFEELTNAIVFRTSTLDARQLHADDAVYTALSETANQLLRQRELSTAERVRATLQSRSDLSNVSVAALALSVGLTPRALQRRLYADGVSLTQLLDEARQQLACQDLRRPNCSIKDLSHRLGFSEPSAFHRAFRRWTGTTANTYARRSTHSGPLRADEAV